MKPTKRFRDAGRALAAMLTMVALLAGVAPEAPGQVVPTLTVSLDSDYIRGHGYVPGAMVTSTIYDMVEGNELWSGASVTNVDGSFFLTDAVHQIDLEPGMVVHADDGTSPKTLELADLAITGLDAEADTVSGTAQATDGTTVDVAIEDESVPCGVVATVTGGVWTADFTLPPCQEDLTSDMGATASLYDTDGDATVAEWVPPPPLPDADLVVGTNLPGPQTLNPFEGRIGDPEVGPQPDRFLTLLSDAVWSGAATLDGAIRDYVPNVLTAIPTVDNGGVVENLDGTVTVTFSIDPLARWSDGTPIIASDFFFTRNLVCDPDYTGGIRPDLTDRMCAPSDQVHIVDPGGVVVDDSTYRFTLSGPSLDYPGLFEVVLHEEAVNAAGGDFFDAWDTTALPGGGPFIVEDFVPDHYVLLARNSNYWGPAPDLGTILIRLFPEDEEGLRNAYAEGLLDIAIPAGSGDAPAWHALEGPDSQIVLDPGQSIHYLGFNLGDGRFEVNANSLLHDNRFRRAVALALDVDVLTSAMYGGIPYDGVDTFFGTSAVAAGNASWAQYAQDVSTASALVTEVENDYETSATLNVIVPNWGERAELVDLLPPAFAAVGIDATVSAVTFQEIIDRAFQPYDPEAGPESIYGAVEAWVIGWGSGFGTHGAVALADAFNMGDWNVLGWGEPDTEFYPQHTQIIDDLSGSSSLDEARVKLREDESLYAGDLVIYPIYARPDVAAVRTDRVTGFVNHPFDRDLWTIADWSAPAGGPVVESLAVAVDQPVSGPGATSVALIDIPVEAVYAAGEASVEGSPLGAVPLGAVDLGASPLGAVPLGAVPLGAVPLGAVGFEDPVLAAIPVDGGWDDILAGSPFAGLPLQTIALSDILTYADANPGSALATNLASTPLGAVDLSGTPLGAVSVLGIGLGTAPLGAVSTEACDAATAAGYPCEPGSTTLFELELAGFDVAAAPLGSVPLGAVPLGAVPLGAVPLGAVPLGAVPLGAVPLGAVPLGAVSADAIPLGSVFLSDVEIGGIPIGAVPLGAVPLGSVPLGAVPLGAVDLHATPLGAVEIGEITGDVCADFVAPGPTCADLGVTDSTTLFEFAVILEAAGSSLGASPLGAVTLDRLPLGAVDLLATTILGPGATLADIFDGTTLADVADWGSITLGQLVIALLIVGDYPWEDLAFDELGVQDFRLAGDSIAYTATMDIGAPGRVEAIATMPAGYRYRAGTSTFDAGESLEPIFDPIITESDGVQTLTWYLDVTPGSSQRLRFGVAPAVDLGTSTIDVTAGEQSALGVAAHTVVPPEQLIQQPAALNPLIQPDVVYLGYITAAEEIDLYDVEPPGQGYRTAVFLGHLSEDVDLVLYRPATAAPSVTGTPLGAVPIEDDGPDGAGDGTLGPEVLGDIPITGTDPIAAASANRSTADESVAVLDDGRTSEYYTVQVSGYNGAVSDDAYVLRLDVDEVAPTPVCPARPGHPTGSSGVPADGLETLFVLNSTRMDAVHGPGSAAAVQSALTGLLAFLNDPANGFGPADILAVDGVDYAAWDANPCDPRAADDVAREIRDLIEAYAAGNPGLKYIAIIGGDEDIPFFRQPDGTAYANEDTYAGEFSGNALYGSLSTRHVLTDDGYGDLDPIPWLDHYLYLPELAVGRLVEAPGEIVSAIDAFIGSGGTLDPATALVTGYDFLTDGAAEVAANLAGHGHAVDASLINETWLDDDLESLLLTADPPDVVSPNAHYDHYRALPGGEQATPETAFDITNLFQVDDVESFVSAGGDLGNLLVFTMGCHAGLNVADTAGGSPHLLDWPQLYSRNGAVYLANTGYGYGDTVTVALSERLMADFAGNLDGRLTLGQAMVLAKQEYYGSLGLYGVYDEKALQEAVLYGLPMYAIGTDGTGIPGPGPGGPPVLTEDPATGLAAASFELTPSFVEQTDPDRGTFFEIAGETLGIHYRPIQPRVTIDVTVAGFVAKGAIITGLETTDVPVPDPAFFRPIIDATANEPEVEIFEQIFPTSFATIADFDVPSTAFGQRTERRQNLNLIAGQYIGPARTQRLFDSVDIEVLYVPVTDPAASDYAAPIIRTVDAAVIGEDAVSFIVDVVDTDVVRVVVLYRDDVSDVWLSTDLVPGSPWSGGGPVSPGATRVDFLAHAVDAAGNVSVTTFKGDFHDAVVIPPDPPDPGTGADIEVSGDQGPGGWYTGDVTVSVTGSGEYTASIDGEPASLPAVITEDGGHTVQIIGTDGTDVTFGVRIDGTPPDVVIVIPADGGIVEQGEGIAADYRCPDAGSGTAACTGPVPPGEPIATDALGSHSFTVSAVDFAGNANDATAVYTVVPALELVVTPTLVATGEQVVATAAVPDTPTVAVVDWGDGSTCNTATDAECDLTAAGLEAYHAYGSAGVYPVHLQVIYPAGTLQDTFESVIVHDGSVRRLVGAGLFRSQPGALIANPSGTATVVFSVFARYRPDRATPVGSVDVWVPLTGLRFTSTQLDWFAAGPGLAKISGEGTFAGSPGYSFTLWAFDAQRDWTDDFRIDRIRLRIWETATGELVYDSACSVDSCASGSSDLVTDMSEVVGWIVIRPDWRW